MLHFRKFISVKLKYPHSHMMMNQIL